MQNDAIVSNVNRRNSHLSFYWHRFFFVREHLPKHFQFHTHKATLAADCYLHAGLFFALCTIIGHNIVTISSNIVYRLIFTKNNAEIIYDEWNFCWLFTFKRFGHELLWPKTNEKDSLLRRFCMGLLIGWQHCLSECAIVRQANCQCGTRLSLNCNATRLQRINLIQWLLTGTDEIFSNLWCKTRQWMTHSFLRYA